MQTRTRSKWLCLISVLMLASMLLGACTPATPTTAPTQAGGQPDAAPAVPTAPPAQPTAEPAKPEGPQVGGTLVIGRTAEPTSLDPHKTAEGAASFVMRYMGASLVYKDVENNYVPWLAERWEATPDGLTWTFFLRKDIKFQDGTPLTANEFVYTFQRALDPATASPAAGQMLAQVDKLEPPDKYTFKVTLKEPFFPFLDNIANPDYMQPLSKAAVEKYGDDYGRNPVVAGPYRLKEWVTGDHITLERNPEYAWQPPYAHQGPRYIQEITCRTIPEIRPWWPHWKPAR